MINQNTVMYCNNLYHILEDVHLKKALRFRLLQVTLNLFHTFLTLTCLSASDMSTHHNTSGTLIILIQIFPQ